MRCWCSFWDARIHLEVRIELRCVFFSPSVCLSNLVHFVYYIWLAGGFFSELLYFSSSCECNTTRLRNWLRGGCAMNDIRDRIHCKQSAEAIWIFPERSLMILNFALLLANFWFLMSIGMTAAHISWRSSFLSSANLTCLSIWAVACRLRG